MSARGGIRTCARCERDRPHCSRGLCNSCYVLTGRDGTRDKYPRTWRRREDLVEDGKFLRDQGIGDREICDRLHLRPFRLRELLSAA